MWSIADELIIDTITPALFVPIAPLYKYFKVIFEYISSCFLSPLPCIFFLYNWLIAECNLLIWCNLKVCYIIIILHGNTVTFIVIVIVVFIVIAIYYEQNISDLWVSVITLEAVPVT